MNKFIRQLTLTIRKLPIVYTRAKNLESLTGWVIELAQAPHFSYLKFPIRVFHKAWELISRILYSPSDPMEIYILRKIKPIVENFPQLECPPSFRTPIKPKTDSRSYGFIGTLRSKSENSKNASTRKVRKTLENALNSAQEILENINKPIHSNLNIVSN